MSGVRDPAVAGSFYASTKEDLAQSLRECFLHDLGPGALPEVAADGPGLLDALVSPHAGFMFSGPGAANGFAALAADGIPETVVILGPSHRGIDRRAAVSLAEAWRTPLGQVSVDTDLCRALIEESDLLVGDDEAHRLEHSLEVQVPFLQFVYGPRAPKICPICVRSHPLGSIDQLLLDATSLGQTIARVLAERRAVVLASTDFSHQVPHTMAERQDRMALDAILALDPGLLLRTVADHDISMCGPVPVAIALAFCLARGPHTAELLRYYTSGDIIGDRSAVVGYGSLVVRRIGGAVS